MLAYVPSQTARV